MNIPNQKLSRTACNSPIKYSMHPFAIKVMTPKERRKARREKFSEDIAKWVAIANEGTTHHQVLYTFYILLLGVGFSVIHGTSHRQLFLDELVNISLGQSIQVPISTFYVLYPLLLLFVHFQMLWQMHLITQKLRQWSAAVRADAGSEGLTDKRRLALNNLLLSHTLFDTGAVAFVARLLLFLIVAIAPLTILVYAQAKFLPFHDQWITILHRVLVLIDGFLTVFAWHGIYGLLVVGPQNGNKNHDKKGKAIKLTLGICGFMLNLARRVYLSVVLTLFSIGCLFASFFVLMFPGEFWEQKVSKITSSISKQWVAAPKGKGSVAYHFLGISCAAGNAGNEEKLLGTDYSKASLWALPASLGLTTVKPRRDKKAINTKECVNATQTTIPSAVLASNSFFANSLLLDNIILTGANLNGTEADKLKRKQKNRVIDGEFDDILAKVETRPVPARNFDYARFVGARLLKVDFSGSSLNGANFSGAQLQGSTVVYKSEGLDPELIPEFDGADLSSGLLSIDASGRFNVEMRAVKSMIHLTWPENCRAMLSIDAPFSKLDLNQSPKSSNCSSVPEQEQSSLLGNLSFSFISSHKDNLEFSAKLTGTNILGQGELVTFEANMPGSTMAFSYINLTSKSMLFKNIDLHFAQLMNISAGAKFENSDSAFAVVHKKIELEKNVLDAPSIERKRLVNGLVTSTPSGLAPRLPILLSKASYATIQNSKEYEVTIEGGDIEGSVLPWCRVGGNRSMHCEVGRLSTVEAKELARMICRYMHEDVDFLAYLEERNFGAGDGYLAGYIEVTETLQGKALGSRESDLIVYINELSKCIDTKKSARTNDRVKVAFKSLYENNY